MTIRVPQRPDADRLRAALVARRAALRAEGDRLADDQAVSVFVR